MPCLIPEILSEIGKELVEDGNSEESVLQFAFSGKQNFKTLKNVIATVTTLEIYDNEIVIGWNNQRSKIRFSKLPKSLICCIGVYVKKLHIEQEINPSFQPMINKMVAKSQLISFSCGSNNYGYNYNVINTILPLFSATLKDLTIPTEAILGLPNYKLHAQRTCFELIKQLTLNETGCYSLKYWHFIEIMIYFSSLEHLKYNLIVELSSYYLGNSCYPDIIKSVIYLLKSAAKVPSKMTLAFNRGCYSPKFPKLDACMKICDSFDYDNSVPDFYSFQKVIPTAGSQSIIFEVQFSK